MFNKGLLKRLVPFFLALGFGLFVASFFVSLTPNIRFNRNWNKHREYHRRMEFENQRLKHENCRLRREMRVREMQRVQEFDGDINELVPPPPPLAPVAPRTIK